MNPLNNTFHAEPDIYDTTITGVRYLSPAKVLKICAERDHLRKRVAFLSAELERLKHAGDAAGV
jgi:hypothetical protein